ncbi:MAG: ABC-type transporter, integral rane subunit [Pelosinus sp.]|jgi:osmoprotectant transport system permease protein|nr:ABC-type transporter, integral rane subunit [Pelosinus sp.]
MMIEESIGYLLTNIDKYYEAVIIHIEISVAAILASLILAIPLGILCAKNSRVSYALINVFNILRIIPSLAILVVAMPILGTGFIPALFALTLLAIPPILINTYVGFKNINPSIIECAEGMGMNAKKILFGVEIPIAMPLIITGLRTSATEVIASATLASYIGAGGLGDFIFTGIGMNDFRIVLIGGMSVALLSVFTEVSLAVVQHSVTRYQRD